MRRSLTRHVLRAVDQSWNTKRDDWRGDVAALLIFEDNAFTDAPTWNPGPDFTPCAGGAWYRDNGDTYTAVVVGVGPKQRPGRDGGEWIDPEVWTVTAPKDEWIDFGSLWDKPHRISWMLDVESAVIQRDLYEGHPAQRVESYWDMFRKQYGFEPWSNRDGQGPLGDKQWLLLKAEPGWQYEPSELDLVDTVNTLVKLFPAKVRVYGYDRNKNEIPTPVGHVTASLSTVMHRLDVLAGRDDQ